MRTTWGIGTVAFIAVTAFVGASGCDHLHWLGVLDGGRPGTDGGGTGNDGAVPGTDAAGPATDGAVFETGGGDGGGNVATGCQNACGAIMGCGLGGYGTYNPGIGYARPYNIGPYGVATGYSSMTYYGYGAYGFRDLEYQQCVSSCETYSNCLGCGTPSERDAIVKCVLANTCPTLLDCLNLYSTIR
jgi:hypothetical protein